MVKKSPILPVMKSRHSEVRWLAQKYELTGFQSPVSITWKLIPLPTFSLPADPVIRDTQTPVSYTLKLVPLPTFSPLCEPRVHTHTHTHTHTPSVPTLPVCYIFIRCFFLEEISFSSQERFVSHPHLRQWGLQAPFNVEEVEQNDQDHRT